MDKRNELLVSIVVPVYKIEEKYLRECLDSLKNQTLKDIEIILVDDGSPDNCGQICDEYARLDNRFKVFHKKNQGVSAARNDGIRHARGEWISFVDADDWVEERMCEAAYNKAVTEGVDIVFFGGYHNYSDASVTEIKPLPEDMLFAGKKDIEELKLLLLGRSYKSLVSKEGSFFCNTVCKLIRTRMLQDNELFFDENFNYLEDCYFNIRLTEYCKSFYYLNECLYHYRMRGTSVSHQYRPNAFREVKRFIDAARQLEKGGDSEKRYDLALSYRCYDLVLENIYPCYLHPDNKASVFQKIRSFQQTMGQATFRQSIKAVRLKDYSGKSRTKAMLLKLNAGWLMLMIILFRHRNGKGDWNKMYKEG